MSDLYEKISFYKGLYKEIAVGFSEDKFLEKPIFIKHFTEWENGNLDKDRSLEDSLISTLFIKTFKDIFIKKENNEQPTA